MGWVGVGVKGEGNRAEAGSEGFGVAMIRYAYSRSAMFDAMGPTVLHDAAVLTDGERETRLWLGFRPYMPQKAEGIRIDPPPSTPSAIGRRPAATAYAEPLEEPPG